MKRARSTIQVAASSGRQLSKGTSQSRVLMMLFTQHLSAPEPQGDKNLLFGGGPRFAPSGPRAR